MILAKSDMIYKSDLALVNLNDYKDSFYYIANIINKAKCTLIQNEELDDFMIDGRIVNVYTNSEGYDLYFEKYKITLVVYDSMIIDYEIH